MGMIGSEELLEVTGAVVADSEGVGVGVGVSIGAWVALPPPWAPGSKVAVVRGSGIELVWINSIFEEEVKPELDVAITW